jgi:dodecin
MFGSASTSTPSVIDPPVIGTSTQSWEDAATTAVKTAGKTLRDVRAGEVIAQDPQIDQTGAITFRTKLQISFKYESDS